MRTDIIVVSGLPRSGTSMMMRMLEAGGITPLTDALRQADPDNPRGYYEYEPVKRLDKDASWMGLAVGKALKVVSSLLENLPSEYAYSVLFMNRAVEEVLASQRAMLLRRVAQGAIHSDAASPERLQAEDEKLRQTYARHLRGIHQWLAAQPNIRTLHVVHREALRDPMKTAGEVAQFLGGSMNVQAMATAIETKLYRQRL